MDLHALSIHLLYHTASDDLLHYCHMQFALDPYGLYEICYQCTYDYKMDNYYNDLMHSSIPS